MYQTILGTLHAFFISYESLSYLFENSTEWRYIVALKCSMLYFIIDSIYLTRNLTKLISKCYFIIVFR